MDDFDSASKQCDEPSCLPVAFLLHRDSYDWKPAYVKTDHMEKRLGGRGLPVSLSANLTVHNKALTCCLYAESGKA